MSAAAAPTRSIAPRAPRPPHLWSRHGVIWGVVLLAFGFVLGLTVTTLGAASTGELGLDRTIAADRFPALVDLAKFVNVALGPGLAATILAVVCVALWALQSLRTAVVFGALTSIPLRLPVRARRSAFPADLCARGTDRKHPRHIARRECAHAPHALRHREAVAGRGRHGRS